MVWARLLAHIAGTVNQELLLKNKISGCRESHPQSSNQLRLD